MGDVSSWLSGCASTKTRARFLSSVSWRRWRCFFCFFSFSSERFPRWRCPRAQMSQPLAHMPSISTRRWEGKLLQRLIWKSILLSIFFFCSLCCQQNMCSGCCFVLVCKLVWFNLFCHSSFQSLSIAAYPLRGLRGGWSRPNDSPDVGCIRQARLHMWLWHRNWPMLSLTFC